MPDRIATIAELWRYPVKGMRGQCLPSLHLDANGVAGDRRFAVRSSGAPSGKPMLTGAERAAMLLYHATGHGNQTVVTTPDGKAFRIYDPRLLAHLQSALPGGQTLSILESDKPLTDVRPIGLLGAGTIAQLAQELGVPVDGRRFRANILLAMDEGFAEDQLVGRHLHLGADAVIYVTERDPRCRIVTLDPETAAADPALMKHLDRRHEGRVGIYATVITPGRLRIGDAVHATDLSADVPSARNCRPIETMTCARIRFQALASALLAPLALSAVGQMHKVAAPEKVTRAVGVYEYVGDLEHPKAARLIPVSLFIGGHFEDAGVYLARPIPFALAGGLRYELQHAGVRQDYLDVIASRDFASSAAAVATPFDDGWFGYGRVSPPPPPKVARLRPNCGNARVVQESDNGKKDDAKPHFGTKPAADEDKPKPTSSKTATPDPCRDDDTDKPDRVSLADERDKNAPDPERPTLHRSPETTANNTGSTGKPDKKPNKPPPATITANGSPADDPDRPTIRHRATDENDPNALPPDPIDLASKERSQALAKTTPPGSADDATHAAAPSASGNDTVGDNASISSGDTMTGRPVLHRGRPVAPAPEAAPATAAKPAVGKSSTAATAIAKMTASASVSSIASPLDAIVAVSDAKDRAAHDYSYHFSSPTERAVALDTLQTMARAVLANPALATDAPEGGAKAATATTPAQKTAARTTTGAHTATATHTSSAAHSTAAARARAHVAATAPAAPPALADEQMNAYQLYFSAPVTYIYSARMPATATAPERFVAVIAQTDAEGKLTPAMRSVTDVAHLDRTPRYRLIDAVDADGSNRASLLMELRAQHTRQFALYRLLGNKPDQIFVSGSTLL